MNILCNHNADKPILLIPFFQNVYHLVVILSRPLLGQLQQVLPSGKEDRFAPLLCVPLTLSSKHWLLSRKSERQGRAPSFRFEF